MFRLFVAIPAASALRVGSNSSQDQTIDVVPIEKVEPSEDVVEPSEEVVVPSEKDETLKKVVTDCFNADEWTDFAQSDAVDMCGDLEEVHNKLDVILKEKEVSMKDLREMDGGRYEPLLDVNDTLKAPDCREKAAEWEMKDLKEQMDLRFKLIDRYLSRKQKIDKLKELVEEFKSVGARAVLVIYLFRSYDIKAGSTLKYMTAAYFNIKRNWNLRLTRNQQFLVKAIQEHKDSRKIFLNNMLYSDRLSDAYQNSVEELKTFDEEYIMIETTVDSLFEKLNERVGIPQQP